VTVSKAPSAGPAEHTRWADDGERGLYSDQNPAFLNSIRNPLAPPANFSGVANGWYFNPPKEGLGYDNSPVAHLWRTLMFPDNPL
jgi:hypothetical protein